VSFYEVLCHLIHAENADFVLAQYMLTVSVASSIVHIGDPAAAM